MSDTFSGNYKWHAEEPMAVSSYKSRPSLLEVICTLPYQGRLLGSPQRSCLELSEMYWTGSGFDSGPLPAWLSLWRG